MADYILKNYLERPLEGKYNSEYSFGKNETLVTAWSANNACVRVKGEDNFKKLREVHKNLLAKEVAVWLGGGGVFKNAGLVFSIIPSISKENLLALEEADKDTERLYQKAKETGIEQKLQKAGFKFFALRPTWIAEDRKEASKYPVQFWLNPMEQDKNNCGWYTVEELEQGLVGKGPIPKKQ